MIFDIALALSVLDDPKDHYKFEDLVNHYCGLMFYIAKGILENEDDQKSAVQDALVALARNFHKISDIKCHETKAYVVTVIESKSINYYNQRKKRPKTVPLEEIQGVSVTEEYLGDDQLSQCILKLPARYRELIQLKYVNGLTNKELAEVFQVSVAGVRKLEQRAKEKLEILCKEEGLL